MLSDKLKENGWCLNVLQNPQVSTLYYYIHTEEMIQNLINEINEFTEEIMTNENRNKEKSVSIYGTTQEVNDKEIIDDVVREYICCLMELQ